MKLIITRQTVAAKRVVRPGEVIEVSEQDARILLSGNKATPYTEPQPTPKKAKK